MANYIALGQQLPAGVFNPQPDPAALPQNLVIVGVYIASSAISSALRPPPHFVVALDLYILYTIALAVITLLEVGMILVGWIVSDAPDRHAALRRTTLRASHIVLVFAVALHQFGSTSTTQATEADAPTK